MIYKVFVCLAIAYSVLGEKVTGINLRGHAVADAAHSAGNEAIHNQHKNSKKHENTLYELMQRIHKEGLEKGTKVTKDFVLSVPDVSYQNFVVTRQRINNDCNGPGTNLI